MIAEASNNDGRINTAHKQTDDGIVISVISGHSLLPISFRYEDYLGECHETLLSASFFPHKRLMHHDDGWKHESEEMVPTFDWHVLEDRTDGFSSGPDGVFRPITSKKCNAAEGVALNGVKQRRDVFYRADREYWTPDHTLQADTFEDIFNNFEQWNPKACEPRKPGPCGILTMEDE